MTVRVLMVTIAVVVSVPCFSQKRNENRGKYKAIHRYMEQAVGEKLTGLVVYISDPKHGEWIGTSGFADVTGRQPIRAGDIFSLASIGKMYNAVAALKLVEEGRIGLDDEISEYLPGDIIANLPSAQQVTVRHLLAQTSGFANYEYDSSLTTLYLSGNLKLDTFPRAEVLRRYVFGKPALNNPGERFHYSSTNYLLLAMVIDKIVPEGHTAYLRNLISKNGFTNTYYRETPPHGNINYYGDLNQDGNVEDLTVQTFETTNWFTGDDGVYAPIAEAAHFLQSLMKGNILNRMLLEQMTTWNDARSPDYGLGLMADKSFPYGLLMGHSGRGIGVTTDLYYFPKQQMTVAIFCNTGMRASAPAFRKSYNKMRSRIVKKLFLF